MLMIRAFVFLLSYAAAQTYCTCGPSSLSYTNLGPVKLAGDSTIILDSTDCPKVIGPRDLTSLSADLTGQGIYTLDYAITVCNGSYYYNQIGAWVDYNHNGVFEADEGLFFANYTGGIPSASQNFVVPKDLKYSGPTRLRVQVQELITNLGPLIDPCFMFPYGATKDFTVVLKPRSPYCDSGPTTPEDTHLGPLLLRGESKDIVQYAEPCPGFLGPTNFTDLIADVVVGQTYPLSLSVVTCRKEYPVSASAWIDWNQNLEWEENERLFTAGKYGAITLTFTVPQDAKTGPTSMRTMVQETDGSTTIGPCDMFKYGATQDYPIEVKSMVP